MIANPLNEIYLPGLETVTYPPKQITTIAVKVTPENIGAMTIEFETELCYTNNGLPFFELEVSRGTEKEPKPVRFITVRVGDWIVVLWDEFHLFREHEFNHTFHVVHPAPQHELTEEDPSVNDFAPGGRGLWNPMVGTAVAGEPPHLEFEETNDPIEDKVRRQEYDRAAPSGYGTGETLPEERL